MSKYFVHGLIDMYIYMPPCYIHLFDTVLPFNKDVRLVGGRNEQEGRVEVKVADK